MNKTALQLMEEKSTNIPVELMGLVIPGSFDSYYGTISRKQMFHTDLFVKRLIKPSSSSHVEIHYNDHLIDGIIIVPANFMFKVPDSDKAAQIISKYQAFKEKNVTKELMYTGEIGSDPEIFCENKDGAIIPAFNFLGSKEEKRNLINGGSYANNIYWDGFQAEFDTQAAGCMEFHVSSIRHGLYWTSRLLKQYDPGAKLSGKTVFEIPAELIHSSKPEHVAFGCMPSLNAYGMEGVKLPGNEVFYRSAGGHIHFGLRKLTKEIGIEPERALKMVKSLDAILGVACVSLFASIDSPRRRQMYGLAGEYRLPSHGMEYRVLSNAWMFHPLIANLVFDLARGAAMMGDKDFMYLWKHDEQETIRIINECDVDAARKSLSLNKEILLKVIDMKYFNDEKTNFVFNILMNGMESIIKNPLNIEDNWNLSDPSWHPDARANSVRSALKVVNSGHNAFLNYFNFNKKV